MGITKEEYRLLLSRVGGKGGGGDGIGKGSKYGNKRVKDEESGKWYDSEGELDFERAVLVPLMRKGKVTYRRQVVFPFVVNGVKVGSYKADWVVKFLDEGGREEVWDFKGFETEIFKLKKKLMRAVYGLEIVLKKRRDYL